MLKRAIQRVIDDASYQLNVEPAATALRQASYIAEWITHDENKAIFDEFETRLVEKFKSCVPTCTTISSVRSFGSVRADICRNYHSLRTSPAFVELWSEFIKHTTTDALPQPTFYQEVTDIMFEGIVTSALPVKTSTASEATDITYNDSNVINYTAGFVSKNLQYCQLFH